MRVCFGSFMLSADGKTELMSFLPEKWQHAAGSLEYVKGGVLHLETDSSLSNACFHDGWNVKACGDESQVVYSRNGEVEFALRYSSPEKEVTVCVNDSQNRRAKLGIQYGMMVMLYQQCIGLHGVTLVCGDEIIILSAPSGTGKTTLAKLLEEYCDAIVINGDFALLHPTEDGVIYEPTPFCGTSGRSLNHRFRVNRVVFLGQAKENIWHNLTGRECMKRFMNNTFVPDWDCDMKQAVQENILKCLSALKVNAYEFAPTEEAADIFLKRVKNDSLLP